MTVMDCVLCGSKRLKEIFRVDNAPMYSQKVLSERKDHNEPHKKTVFLFQCQDCDMVQLDVNDLSQKEYFDDYLVSRSCTGLCTTYENRLAAEFVRRFDLHSKHIVEIGCGDGYFSERLVREGALVSAIEPSKTACSLARKRGINCYNIYLDDSVERHVKEKFDGFVAKQVLDLIKEPNNFLRNLGKIIKVGAYGLIDVPSLTKTVFDCRYYDILPDRVSYFTTITLAKMLEKNNFHVIDIAHGADDEYLVSYMRYEGDKGRALSQFNDDFQNFKEQFSSLIGKLSADSKTIAAWGAGAKGASLLSFCNANSTTIQYVIDKDQHKWGSYLYGSLLKIVPPDILNREAHPDSIIITAVMYYREIIKELVNNYQYKGNIVLLSPQPHIISEDEIKNIDA